VPYVKRLLMAEVLEEKNVKIMFDAARVGWDVERIHVKGVSTMFAQKFDVIRYHRCPCLL
jgi:hypothetical protein